MEQEFRIHTLSMLRTDVHALQRYLQEDLGFGDITSRIIPDGTSAEAELVVKEDAVAAGLEEAATVFGMLGVPVKIIGKDGERIQERDVVMKVRGDVVNILAGERVALNILSRMSGIATLTQRLVDRTRAVNPGIRIACSRKTTPGFRFFEKKAVVLGGGDPHRFRLDDCIMLKDNHLRTLGSIKGGVERARTFSFTKKVEVEVENLDLAVEAARAGADIIMLDNMNPPQAGECYRTIKDLRTEIIVEVSGGITPDNIMDYAEFADVISLGYLTHSYRSVDFSLEVL